MRLTESEYRLLRELQRNERHKRNYVKATVLLMLHHGNSRENISISLGISVQTVSNYIQAFEQVGLEKYLESNYIAYSGKLDEEQKAMLGKELEENIYHTTKEIRFYVKEHFGIDYTCQGLSSLLRSLGFVYKKTTLVACERDVEAQSSFVESLNDYIAEVAATDAVLYFADGVHPQHNTRSTYAWIKRGSMKEVLSVSGRSRMNINAVMNVHDPCDIVMVEGASIDAENTYELYKKIEAKHPKAKKIYIICDNARYYRNKLLKERLVNSRIEQIFLPAYSPNLNLIERLWKFMRKKVINSIFYRKFEDFRQAIRNFFSNIKDFRAELETLMSCNFHVT